MVLVDYGAAAMPTAMRKMHDRVQIGSRVGRGDGIVMAAISRGVIVVM